MSFLSKILTSPSVFKSHKCFLICWIQTPYFEEFCFFIEISLLRNLVDEALNQGKMIFWFNLEQNNLKDIENYPCILYLKFLWYRRNQMLWDRFNQQNDENKILGWKKKNSVKNLSKRLIRILHIKHSWLQEIKADTFLTTIKTMQKSMWIVTKVSL